MDIYPVGRSGAVAQKSKDPSNKTTPVVDPDFAEFIRANTQPIETKKSVQEFISWLKKQSRRRTPE